MENYVKKYKPFLVFLAKFFLTYVLMTVAYQTFLSRYDEKKNEIDPVTISVSEQAKQLLLVFDAPIEIRKHESQPSIKLFYGREYVARIIEGCNAISVMILFVAFIVAFSGTWKHTLLFILGGCILIHVLNIVRIALLCAMIYHFPEQEHFLHGVIFPLFIYSVVFILWVIWVNNYSSYAKKAARP